MKKNPLAEPKRLLIVDRDCDYSNKEIQDIQKRLDKIYDIFVYRDCDRKGLCLLVAKVPIKYSFAEACDIIGVAYCGEDFLNNE
jgi:hypothetical protein